MGHQTRQGAALHWQAPILNSHMTLWALDIYEVKWELYISTIEILIVSKSARVLTYERTFSTQTPKSSPTSCHNKNNILITKTFKFTNKYFRVTSKTLEMMEMKHTNVDRLNILNATLQICLIILMRRKTSQIQIMKMTMKKCPRKN